MVRILQGMATRATSKSRCQVFRSQASPRIEDTLAEAATSFLAGALIQQCSVKQSRFQTERHDVAGVSGLLIALRNRFHEISRNR
jgi:hypothetical protein